MTTNVDLKNEPPTLILQNNPMKTISISEYRKDCIAKIEAAGIEYNVVHIQFASTATDDPIRISVFIHLKDEKESCCLGSNTDPNLALQAAISKALNTSVPIQDVTAEIEIE